MRDPELFSTTRGQQWASKRILERDKYTQSIKNDNNNNNQNHDNHNQNDNIDDGINNNSNNGINNNTSSMHTEPITL